MIVPSYGLTATERLLPRLALDFTTGVFDPRITYTRSGSTASRFNASGSIETVPENTPRLDYDPTTLVCRGLLIEESRTNLLLNSTSLATQSVTVSAAAHTLSFYGTGEIVLSGTHSATVSGTGAFPQRRTLTFTPTAGTLTLTVTGTVQYAQLETGSFATSYIPTTGSSATRNVEAAVMTGTNFSSWFVQGAGAVSFTASSFAQGADNTIFCIADDLTTQLNQIDSRFASSGTVIRSRVRSNNATTLGDLATSAAAFTPQRVAFAFNTDNAAASNGVTLVTDIAGALPLTTMTRLIFGDKGAAGGTDTLNGHIAKFAYYNHRITDAEVVAFAK